MKSNSISISREVVKNANNYLNDSVESEITKSYLLGRSYTDEIKGMKMLKEEKLKERIMKEDNHANLQKIAQNTEYILQQFGNFIMTLKSIDKLLQNNEIQFMEIMDELKEQKHIDADIYSVLVQSQIDTEENRIKTSENLGSLLVKGLDVSVNLTTILNAIINRTI